MRLCLSFILISLFVRAQQMPDLSVEGISGSGVQVLHYPQPEFLDILDRWLEAETRAALEPVLRYSIMLRNASSKPIACAAVIWHLRNFQNMPITHTIRHTNILADPRVMIQPGQALFMSPEGSLSRKIVLGPRVRIANLSWAWRDRDLYDKQQSIHVTLDSVIWEDGRLLGPDKARNMFRVNEMVRAETDLAEEVLGLGDDKVESLLKRIREDEDRISDANFGPATAYHFRKGQLAGSLLNIIQRQGVSSVKDVMNANRNSSKITPIYRGN